jgi:hypothetical protein
MTAIGIEVAVGEKGVIVLVGTGESVGVAEAVTTGSLCPQAEINHNVDNRIIALIQGASEILIPAKLYSSTHIFIYKLDTYDFLAWFFYPEEDKIFAGAKHCPIDSSIIFSA